MQEKLILTDLTEKELLELYNKVIKHIEYLNGSIISRTFITQDIYNSLEKVIIKNSEN